MRWAWCCRRFCGRFLSLGFTLPQLFLAAALACAAVSVYICALLPDALTRSLVQSLLGFLFRSKVGGIANFKRAGSKVLIVSNHVSLLDGVLLAAFMPERITFAINTGWTQKWFIPVIRLLVDFYPVDPANPLSVRSLAEEIKKGRKVMIFPEGRVTTTGAMMKVYEGAGVIAAKAGAKILPVRINGAQYSKFSYLKDKFPTRWFPKITLNILEPCRFPAVSAGNREARHKIARRLYNLMAEMMYKTTESRAGLSEALVLPPKLTAAGILPQSNRANDRSPSAVCCGKVAFWPLLSAAAGRRPTASGCLTRRVLTGWFRFLPFLPPVKPRLCLKRKTVPAACRVCRR